MMTSLSTWRRLCACLLVASLASICWISYHISRSIKAKGIGYPVARQTKDKIEDKPWELLSLRSWRHDVSDNKPDVISKRHDVIPRVVHYVWCGLPTRQFEFRHFLSMRSSIRYLDPDVVYFHHDHLPQVDTFIYNTWLMELTKDFPFITLQRHDTPFCDGHLHASHPQWFFLNNILNQYGGFYVRENTVFLEELHIPPSAVLLAGVTEGQGLIGVTQDHGLSFLGAKREISHSHSLQKLLQAHSQDVATVQCLNQPDWSEDEAVCVRMAEQPLYPKDLWDDENLTNQKLRLLLYGSPKLPQPILSNSSVIPNVAHIVWFGGGQMTFTFYLSVLSLLYVVCCDDVIIHGDAPPTGSLWNRLQDEKKLHWMYRARPNTVYGQVVSVTEHAADVTRVDLMLRYGGIHLDPDVIFTRPIPPDLYMYDAVASFDNRVFPMKPFPEVITMGLTMTRPGGKFWQLCQRSHMFYNDKDWTWNSGRVPYKLYERHPDILRIEPFLHVVCIKNRCYPTWVKTRQESLQLADVIDTWWQDVYAFHLVDDTPQEMTSEVTVASGVGVFAQMAHVVLKAAGRL